MPHHHRHHQTSYPIGLYPPSSPVLLPGLYPPPGPVFLPRHPLSPVLLPGPPSPVVLSRPPLSPVLLPGPPVSPVLLPKTRVQIRYRLNPYFKKGDITSLFDKDDLENIINIGIIYVNSGKVLLVKNKVLNQWMIPFGKRYFKEEVENALERIFTETLGFGFNLDKTNMKQYIRMHQNKELSKIYKIETDQSDELPSKDLIYIPLEDLEQLIKHGTSYDRVNSLLDFTKTLLNDTFFK